MSVTVKTVCTKRELKAFVKFPLELYKNCPYYVPGLFMDEMATLDPAKNPMSKYAKFRLFLAYKDGKLVGRVAAIQSPHRCCIGLRKGNGYDPGNRSPGLHGF